MNNSAVGIIILVVVAAIAIAIGLSKSSKTPAPKEDYGDQLRKDVENMGLDYDQMVIDETKAREARQLEKEERIKRVEARNMAYVTLSEEKAEADALTLPKYRIIRNLENMKYNIQEATYSSGAFEMDIGDYQWDYHSYTLEEAEDMMDEWETEEPLGSVSTKWTKVLYEYDTYQDAEKALSIFIAMESEDTTEVKYYDRTAKRT